MWAQGARGGFGGAFWGVRSHGVTCVHIAPLVHRLVIRHCLEQPVSYCIAFLLDDWSDSLRSAVTGDERQQPKHPHARHVASAPDHSGRENSMALIRLQKLLGEDAEQKDHKS